MAKKKANSINSPVLQGSDNQKNKANGFLFGLLAFSVATLIMIAVVGGAFYIIIHNNINGLADKYRMNLQNVPVLKLALPKPSNPDDDKYMSEAKVREKYRELLGKRDELEKQLEDANNTIKQMQIYKDETVKLKTENDNIKKDAAEKQKQIDERAKQLDELKKKIDELIAKGDKTGFKEYYEKVEKEIAAKVYADIMKEQRVSDKTKEFAKLYEAMDPSAAAKIFEEFGKSKIDLVVDILKYMKKEASAEILAAMDSAYAAKVTEKLKTAYLK